MDKKLLICIAFHYNLNKLTYLRSVLDNFSNYDLKTTIFVDTNSYETVNSLLDYPTVFVYAHTKLKHPHHLAWIHRQHMKDLLDDFDYFTYIEDDIIIPFENFKEYLNNFEYLFPNYIPSFIRLEHKKEEWFVVDMQKRIDLLGTEIVSINDKKFITLERPYHAFWIMPTKELKETITNDFVKYNECREMAASYPMSELKKRPLIMLDDNNKISSLCYSFHLPNNYANMEGSEHKFGRIKIEELISI